MARLYADLPLPVAAACVDAIGAYAHNHQNDGDDRPIGQIRTEVLTDLILRPWDTTRPTVTAEVTIHLTIPTLTGGPSTVGLDDYAAEAEVDGQTISAAQCRELLTQLDSSRLFLALHNPDSGALRAVATHSQLRRAARRRRKRSTKTPGGANGDGCAQVQNADGPGLRAPEDTPNYRPTRAQDRHVRTRDRGCRHFGCTRKAVHCDLDHHQPWPDGNTAICNLCCYCRTHHRLNTKHPAGPATLKPTAP